MYFYVLKENVLSRIFSRTLRSAGHSKRIFSKLAASVISASQPDEHSFTQVPPDEVRTFVANIERKSLEWLGPSVPLPWRCSGIEEARYARANLPD